jgi:hypothetical protein
MNIREGRNLPPRWWTKETMEGRKSKMPRRNPGAKETYEKPRVESEQMFETKALACGKCTSGPFPQFACGLTPSGS